MSTSPSPPCCPPNSFPKGTFAVEEEAPPLPPPPASCSSTRQPPWALRAWQEPQEPLQIQHPPGRAPWVQGHRGPALFSLGVFFLLWVDHVPSPPTRPFSVGKGRMCWRSGPTQAGSGAIMPMNHAGTAGARSLPSVTNELASPPARGLSAFPYSPGRQETETWEGGAGGREERAPTAPGMGSDPGRPLCPHTHTHTGKMPKSAGPSGLQNWLLYASSRALTAPPTPNSVGFFFK